MLRTFSALAALLLALPALAAEPARVAAPPPGQPGLPPAPEPGTNYKTVRGMLARQASGLQLRPCEGGNPVGLIDPGKDSPAAAAMQNAIAGGGGEFFAELGVREEADGRYQLLTLNLLRLPRGGARTGCRNTYAEDEIWRIAGWGPAYMLSVTRDSMVLRRPQARISPARFPAPPPTQTPDGTWRYQGTAPAVGIAGYTLDVRPGLCREGGSGNLYGWQAILVVDGNLLAGCAAAAVHP